MGRNQRETNMVFYLLSELLKKTTIETIAHIPQYVSTYQIPTENWVIWESRQCWPIESKCWLMNEGS